MSRGPTAKAGNLSNKNPGRHPGSCHTTDGQVDILIEYDTRYPDLKSKRTFTGNGPVPENPFGHKIPEPDVG